MSERLFVNARVFTGGGETEFRNAFLVADGRFAWVGDAGWKSARSADAHSETHSEARFAGAEVVDLAGACVVPGLLDVHHHPVLTASLAPGVCLLPPAVAGVDDVVRLMRTHSVFTDGHADPSEWALGWGYDELYTREARHLTRHDLDRVSTNRPVLVRRSDMHSAACNTAALRLAGIDKDTPDPYGARFERDPDGTPNGTLTEMGAVEAVMAAMAPMRRTRLVDELVRLGRHLARHGIVAVGDMAAIEMDDVLGVLREAEAAGMPQRVAVYLPWTALAANPRTLDAAEKTGRVKVAGAKLFCDGAVSNRTAWMTGPYRGTTDHTGTRSAPDTEIRGALAWCRENGVQLALHAMGDAAVANLVDVVGGEEPWLEGVPSVRIEHASILTEEAQQRIASARVGIAVVTHAIFDWAEHATYAAALSDEQMANAYPLRRLYAGLPAACLASDRPATIWADADNVFTSMQSAVTRVAHDGADLGRDQRLSVAQTLLMYTSRSARCAPLDSTGRIVAGAEADFVVLDRDVFAQPACTLGEVRPVQTWIGGRRVFDLGDA